MGGIRKGLRKARRKVDPRTGIVREVPLTEMHECTLRTHLSEGVQPGETATHLADTIAPCPHQLIGNINTVRAGRPMQRS